MASKEAQVAARWWRDTMESGAKMDNGGGDLASAFASDLATMLIEVHSIGLTSENWDVFEETLTQIIDGFRNNGTGRFEKFGSYYRTLSVDYGPNLILRSAADRAGINESLFPWKTVMWIDEGSVKVGYGYGAEAVEIMPKYAHATRPDNVGGPWSGDEDYGCGCV